MRATPFEELLMLFFVLSRILDHLVQNTTPCRIPRQYDRTPFFVYGSRITRPARRQKRYPRSREECLHPSRPCRATLLRALLPAASRQALGRRLFSQCPRAAVPVRCTARSHHACP